MTFYKWKSWCTNCSSFIDYNNYKNITKPHTHYLTDPDLVNFNPTKPAAFRLHEKMKKKSVMKPRYKILFKKRKLRRLRVAHFLYKKMFKKTSKSKKRRKSKNILVEYFIHFDDGGLFLIQSEDDKLFISNKSSYYKIKEKEKKGRKVAIWKSDVKEYNKNIKQLETISRYNDIFFYKNSPLAIEQELQETTRLLDRNKEILRKANPPRKTKVTPIKHTTNLNRRFSSKVNLFLKVKANIPINNNTDSIQS